MIGEAGVEILNAGTTPGRIAQIDATASTDPLGRIFSGALPLQASYPAVQIENFGEPEDCKDGLAKLFFTMTVIVWGENLPEVADISNEVIKDLVGKRGTYGGYKISGIRLGSIGPIIPREWKEDRRIYGRPLDFEVGAQFFVPMGVSLN